MPETAHAQRWRERAVALHTRFVIDLVEAYDFCPWARAARIAGRTRVVALFEDELDGFLSSELQHPDHAQMEVWQLVVLDVDTRAMAWRSSVAETEQRLRRREVDLPWAFAAFHPDHPGRPETIGGTIGMLRRSPFAAIQLVRLDVLDRVRERASAQVEGLAERNRAELARWLNAPEQVRLHAQWLAAGRAIRDEIAAFHSEPSSR